MATLNLEVLDDPLLFDTVPDFSGGQVSNHPASVLAGSQYSSGLNVDIKTKLAVTRRGTISLGQVNPGSNFRVQSLQWFDTPSLEYLVAAADGQLWKYDETSWTSLNAYQSLGPTDAQIGMAQVVGTMYIADNSTDLYSWDGTTLTDLGTGSSTQPPQGNIILAFTFRLFIAGVTAFPDAIYVSTSLVTAWDTAKLMIRIGTGDNDPIIGLAPWDTNQVVVLKRNSVYILEADPLATATDLSTATVTKVTDRIGCVAQRSVQVVGNDVWFLSDFGIRSVRRVLAQTQREVSEDLSEPVHDVIQRINWLLADKCASFYWDNKYMLSLPLDEDLEPTVLLVFDTLQQAFSGVWTGWTPLCFVLTKANQLQRVNFGQPDGTVSRWLDFVPIDSETLTTFQDNGVNIQTQLVSRGMIFGDGTANTSNKGLQFVDGQATKSPFSVEASFYQSAALADVSLAFDQGEEGSLEEGFVTQGGIPLILPFFLPAVIGSNAVKRRVFPARQFNAFREMQVIVNSSQDKLALRAIAASAFGDTVAPEVL